MICPKCNGDGFFVEPDHSMNCNPHTGECTSDCPQPRQIQCAYCEGTGTISKEKTK